MILRRKQKREMGLYQVKQPELSISLITIHSHLTTCCFFLPSTNSATTKHNR
ncbi:hypothetical protein LINGRAHAP2_LOCUS28826 [Linum grandiflorum]